MKKSFKLLFCAGTLSIFVLTACGQNPGNDHMNGTSEGNGNPQDATSGNSSSMDVDSTREYSNGGSINGNMNQ